MSAIKAIEGNVVDCGVLTTPMLHYFVATANQRQVTAPPSNQEYYKKLANSFIKLNNFVSRPLITYTNLRLAYHPLLF